MLLKFLTFHICLQIETTVGGVATTLTRPRLLTLKVEFYFGDANLHKDRFLKEKIAEHPERCERHPALVDCHMLIPRTYPHQM